MIKKAITVEIPKNLADLLNELAKKTGRKKNLLLAASLNDFLKASNENKETIIRKYLDTYQE